MPRIRLARKTDRQGIMRLVWNARLNPLGIDWRRFWLVEDDRGNLLACGQIKTHMHGIKELASLVVIPDWRGRGIARLLIEALMNQAGPHLWLTCHSRLIPFYARFGIRGIQNHERMPFYFKMVRVFGILLHRLWNLEAYLAIVVWESGKPTGKGYSGA